MLTTCVGVGHYCILVFVPRLHRLSRRTKRQCIAGHAAVIGLLILVDTCIRPQMSLLQATSWMIVTGLTAAHIGALTSLVGWVALDHIHDWWARQGVQAWERMASDEGAILMMPASVDVSAVVVAADRQALLWVLLWTDAQMVIVVTTDHSVFTLTFVGRQGPSHTLVLDGADAQACRHVVRDRSAMVASLVTSRDILSSRAPRGPVGDDDVMARANALIHQRVGVLDEAAAKLQRAWHRAISDPMYSLCRSRLLTEFTASPPIIDLDALD